MKTDARSDLLAAILAPCVLTQTNSNPVAPEPSKVRISSALAEKFLIHKSDLACRRVGMPARVTGTVVVAIEISKHGDVLHPKVISGPRMLRLPVLDAVRKHQYKPYLLNHKAVEAETTVSVTVDSYRDCHFE